MLFKVGDSVRVKRRCREDFLHALGEKLVDENEIVYAESNDCLGEFYAVKAINGWNDIDKGHYFGGVSKSYYYISPECLELIPEKESSEVYYNALMNMAEDIIRNYDMDISLDEFVNKYVRAVKDK